MSCPVAFVVSYSFHQSTQLDWYFAWPLTVAIFFSVWFLMMILTLLLIDVTTRPESPGEDDISETTLRR